MWLNWIAPALLIAVVHPEGEPGECYRLVESKTYWKSAEDQASTGSGTPYQWSTTHRQGEPLTAEQIEAVAAAGAMLVAWEACGLTGGPLPASDDPEPPQSPGGNLLELLNSGNVCLEVAASESAVAASASNPHTGNGVETDPDGILDDDGALIDPDGHPAYVSHRWSTTGHPGVNVQGNRIPKKGPDGQFDEGELASLAGDLLHEMSHLDYPNNEAATGAEYEGPAYAHVVAQLCKVVNCPSTSPAVKLALCTTIETAIVKLESYGYLSGAQAPNLSYEPCIACDDSDSQAGVGGSPLVDILVPPSTYIGPHDPDPVTLQYYVGPQLGHVILDRRTGDLSVSLASAGTAGYVVTGPDFLGSTGLIPSSFVQISDMIILVGGVNSIDGHAELVAVFHDPEVGVLGSLSVWSGSELTIASRMAKFPLSSRVAILDRHDAALFCFDFASTTLTSLTSVDAEADMAHMQEVSVLPMRERRTGLAGIEIKLRPGLGPEHGVMVVEEELQLNVLDRNGDGLFDVIY